MFSPHVKDIESFFGQKKDIIIFFSYKRSSIGKSKHCRKWDGTASHLCLTLFSPNQRCKNTTKSLIPDSPWPPLAQVSGTIQDPDSDTYYKPKVFLGFLGHVSHPHCNHHIPRPTINQHTLCILFYCISQLIKPNFLFVLFLNKLPLALSFLEI